MPRAARVSKAEITRVLLSLKAAGETIRGIALEPGGKITVLLGGREEPLTPLQQDRLAHTERDDRARAIRQGLAVELGREPTDEEASMAARAEHISGKTRAARRAGNRRRAVSSRKL